MSLSNKNHSNLPDYTDLVQPGSGDLLQMNNSSKGLFNRRVVLADVLNESKQTIYSTIPPMNSFSWRKLSRFQHRFYTWLVNNHGLRTGTMTNNETSIDEGDHQSNSGPYNNLSQYNVPDLNRSLPYHSTNDHKLDAYSILSGESRENLYDGMDDRLVQFVSKHNVVMDDGAVIYTGPSNLNIPANKPKRKVVNIPFGWSRQKFIIVIVLFLLLLVLFVIAVVLGVIYGGPAAPSFPAASPWWRKGVVYQLHVPTWANDVNGVIGRLKDVTPRMEYLNKRMRVSAAIITGLLDSDDDGVINWQTIDSLINPEQDSVNELLNALKNSATSQSINLIIGAPLYATSIRHPWFVQSSSLITSEFTGFYVWRKEAPMTAAERRYYAYNVERKEYYRHVHGNPRIPLINLNNPGVQTQMKAMISFWKNTLGVFGFMITNSTNIIPEMAASLNSILESEANDSFVWFSDTVEANVLMQNKRVCFFELILKERIGTRTDDISAQLNTALKDPRLLHCSPIWQIVQEAEDFTDYTSIKILALFLPGLYHIKAGEEVDLMTGASDLIQWSNSDRLDYATYWPLNPILGSMSEQKVNAWTDVSNKIVSAGIFETAWKENEVYTEIIPFTENLFVSRRKYIPNEYTATFFVSFQTLNVYTNLADVISSKKQSVQLIYDSRGEQMDLIDLKWIYLKNNAIYIVLV